jgi:hypothetical protein
MNSKISSIHFKLNSDVCKKEDFWNVKKLKNKHLFFIINSIKNNIYFFDYVDLFNTLYNYYQVYILTTYYSRLFNENSANITIIYRTKKTFIIMKLINDLSNEYKKRNLERKFLIKKNLYKNKNFKRKAILKEIFKMF